MSAFASLLRELRIAASRTQEVLAGRCRVSQATIGAFEQGRRQQPHLWPVALIADSLDGLLPTRRGWPGPPCTQAHPPSFPSARVLR